MSRQERVRVLVTGSREFTDVELVRQALNRVRAERPGEAFVIVHGDARGADRIARDLARAAPDTLAVDEPHPARWRAADGSTDRAAGHRRNAQMVASGAAVCLAFYRDGAGNRGTDGCVRLARTAGIPVVTITQTGEHAPAPRTERGAGWAAAARSPSATCLTG